MQTENPADVAGSAAGAAAARDPQITRNQQVPQIPQIPSRNLLAAAVVVHESRVLVVRRSFKEGFLPGTWGVPCGKLDPGEQAGDAVLRELHEETGLLGEVVAAAGERSFVSERNGRPIQNVQFNFLVRALTFDVVLPEPDQDHRWVPTAELADAALDAHNLGTIRQALQAQLIHSASRRSSRA